MYKYEKGRAALKEGSLFSATQFLEKVEGLSVIANQNNFIVRLSMDLMQKSTTDISIHSVRFCPDAPI